MRNHKPGPGRKSKGPRKPFRSQFTPELAERVWHEAGMRDLSASEYLTICLGQCHGFELQMPTPLRPLEPFESDEPQVVTNWFMVRLPMAVAAAVEQEADSREMSYSKYIARVVEMAHGFDVELPERVKPVSEQLEIGVLISA